MLHSLVNFLLDFTSSFGYFGVFLLMTVESSFVPFPSEVVIPPAAYLASKGEMNLILVVLFGILGSLVGAIINYAIARSLGRLLVYELVDHKFAKYFLLSRSKVEKAEKYFLDYGGLSTFLGRLLPGIRQLISLPAGFVRMGFLKFIGFTALGSGLWVLILALLGYYFGEKQEVFELYYKEISLGAIFVVAVVVAIFYLNRRRKR